MQQAAAAVMKQENSALLDPTVPVLLKAITAVPLMAAAARTQRLSNSSMHVKPPFPAGIGRTSAAANTAQAAIFLMTLPPLQPPERLMRRCLLVEIGPWATANSADCVIFRTTQFSKSDAENIFD
jgi:hypothetical protein